MPRDSLSSRSIMANQTYAQTLWTRMQSKLNGGHQLLPTTDSPTISACTTSTNLSGLDNFQSSSTIDNFFSSGKDKNIRIAYPETEPLQEQKLDMSINSSPEALSNLNKEEEKNGKKPRLLRQVITAIAVSWVSLVVGYVSGYTSPAEISLKRDMQVDNYHFSWITGCMPLAAVIGGILGGPLIEFLGRKRTILLTNVLFAFGWLLNYFAKDFRLLYFTRTIAGCAVGITSLTLPVYLSETIQPEVRGTLGLLPTAFGNIGILLCFVMGFFLQWREIAGVGFLVSLPFMVLFFIIPETPRWYISKGRVEESRQALLWLRGGDQSQNSITKELNELLNSQSHSSEKSASLKDLFTKPNVRSLLIILGLMLFQQMSGINAIIFYTTQIFEDTGSDMPSSLQTIIVGGVNFISTFIATLLIDKLGRKILLYISSSVMVVTLSVLGGYFYFLPPYQWIPLVSFMFYVLAFSLGFGPIPWLMMGEILPARIRGPAASVSTAFNWIVTFVVTTSFHMIKDVIGSHGVFWLFAASAAVGLVFTALLVPETKGQSLEDIERKMAGVKVRRMSSVANMKPLPSGV